MKRCFNNPFKSEGTWFKGNLHTHSTASDGTRSCEQLAKLYRETEYDFLSITDHGVLTEYEGDEHEGLLLLPGEEISVGKSEAGTTFHIVGVNIEDEIPLVDFDREVRPQTAIDSINELGGIAILAHPYWSGLNHHDMRTLSNYTGVEIYNATCDVKRNLGLSAVHIDGVLNAGIRSLIFATDDHHGEEGEFSTLDALQAWIMVKAKNLTREDIISSIREGLFYSSTGPEIKNIEIDDRGITVETTPVRSISFVSNPTLGEKFIAKNEPLTKITYPGREHETYVRIEATDYEGKSAWSNPIYNE